MRPFHLHDKESRDYAIGRLDDEAKHIISPYEYRDALFAAAALLRDAAPWPDEALVVSVQRWQDEGPMTCERLYRDHDGHAVGLVMMRRRDAWRLNLGANLAAAGMAAMLHRLLIRACRNEDCDCSSGRMQRSSGGGRWGDE